MDAFGIGIDLGCSSVKAVTVDAQGILGAQGMRAFDADTPADWARCVRDQVAALEAAARRRADWLGISAPGLAARDGRSIAYMPGRLAGLEGWDWMAYLGRTQPVPVLNDGQAALLGERWLGAARDCQNVILLTLGTGVGGAAMVDGRLLRGHLGRAGHLGHTVLDPEGPPDVTGAPGSLETALGNCTIRERSGGRYATTQALIEAHQAGEPAATRIWLGAVKALAAALCSFINILDPERVVIGGGIARAGDTLFAPLRRFLAPIEWRPGGWAVPVVPAELGEYAGAIGAAFQALSARKELGL